MYKNITRKETKVLVRRLRKKLSVNRAQELKNVELFYKGYNDLKWEVVDHTQDQKGETGIKLLAAYREDGAGDYVRMPLGKLDEVFYNIINSKDFRRYNGIPDHLSLNEKVARLDSGLRYLKIRVLVDRDKNRKLNVAYFNIKKYPKPKNKEYTDYTGQDMEYAFIGYMENNDHDIDGIEADSGNGMMSVSIGEEYKKYWKEFINATIDFDKILHKG